MVVAPALMAASTQRHRIVDARCGWRPRPTTRRPRRRLRAWVTVAVMISSTSSSALAASCACRWIGEVETKVWMRGRLRVAAPPRRRGRCRLTLARARPRDRRVLDALGDLGHGLEIAVRGDREARLDDVDAHGVEAARRPRASPRGSWWRRGTARRRAGWCRRSGRGRLAEPEIGGYGHRSSPSRSERSSGRSGLVPAVRTPECPGASAQPTLRGGLRRRRPRRSARASRRGRRRIRGASGAVSHSGPDPLHTSATLSRR